MDTEEYVDNLMKLAIMQKNIIAIHGPYAFSIRMNMNAIISELMLEYSGIERYMYERIPQMPRV